MHMSDDAHDVFIQSIEWYDFFPFFFFENAWQNTETHLDPSWWRNRVESDALDLSWPITCDAHIQVTL